MIDDYKYLGDFSATPPWFSVSMSCDHCKVKWTGCWDNFECPQCGQGELPYNMGLDLSKEYSFSAKYQPVKEITSE